MKGKCYQGLLSIDTRASKQQSDLATSAMPNMNWISFSGKSTCKCLGPTLHLILQCSIMFVRQYYLYASESTPNPHDRMKLKIRKAKGNFKKSKNNVKTVYFTKQKLS